MEYDLASCRLSLLLPNSTEFIRWSTLAKTISHSHQLAAGSQAEGNLRQRVFSTPQQNLELQGINSKFLRSLHKAGKEIGMISCPIRQD